MYYNNNNQCQYRSECELPMQVAKHMRRWLEERVVHTLVAGSRSIAAHVSWYSCFCVCLCFFLCVSVCFCLCVCVCVCLSLMLLLLFLDHVSVHTHNHTLPHSHTMLITCTCCYDLTKGTQDKDFSYSFSILSLSPLTLIAHYLPQPVPLITAIGSHSPLPPTASASYYSHWLS